MTQEKPKEKDQSKEPTQSLIKLMSYNIHKGFSLTGRFTLRELRENISLLDLDLVFLQELQDQNNQVKGSGIEWPDDPVHVFLKTTDLQHSVYGKNAIYEHGHHGNAILSRYPLSKMRNLDLSHSRWERRGILLGEVTLPGPTRIYVLCTHLNLLERSRFKQLDKVTTWIEQFIPEHAPLIWAGDFNDWTGRLANEIMRRHGLKEVFLSHKGKFAKSFPARFPLLSLDRIFVRDLSIRETQVLTQAPWTSLSDHAPLLVTLEY